jgi:sulfite reductase beta subunit-like hemoprotein
MNLDTIKKYNSSNIFSEKQYVFNELKLSNELIKEFHKKLQYYKVIDNISQINEGKYIRWINLNTNKLTNGALVCDIEITDQDILIYCKTINNIFITISYNKNILFEKISDDELLLINVVDNFNK